MTNSPDFLAEQDQSVPATELQNGFSRRVIGNQVIVRQGGAQSIEADHLIIRQGGAATARATRMEVSQGGIGYAQTDAASLTASQAGGLIAGGDIHMDQSAGYLIAARGSVTVDQSAIGVLIANEVKAERTTSIFLIAKKVEGPLTTLFGTREALLFGATAGVAIGLVALIGKAIRFAKGAK